jgi:hypothetical protein
LSDLLDRQWPVCHAHRLPVLVLHLAADISRYLGDGALRGIWALLILDRAGQLHYQRAQKAFPPEAALGIGFLQPRQRIDRPPR